MSVYKKLERRVHMSPSQPRHATTTIETSESEAVDGSANQGCITFHTGYLKNVVI